MAEPISDKAAVSYEAPEGNSDHRNDASVQNEESPPISSPVGSSSPSLFTTLKTSQPALAGGRTSTDMDAETEAVESSSVTVVDEVDCAASDRQISQKDIASAAPTKSPDAHTHTHSMLPPPVPASNTMPFSQQPPRSGQGSQSSESSQIHDTSTNMHGTNGEDIPDNVAGDDMETLESSVAGDPADEIETFDWDSLQRRYHDKIGEINEAERDIITEFENLCSYFSIWAQSGANREVDRTFKRLKTQMTLVQHHEDELEQKRLHYVKVVDKFKEALELLVG